METSNDSRAPVEGEDFYREGAYIVFTARHHLRRGYCCGSNCRHCPYGVKECSVETVEETKPARGE